MSRIVKNTNPFLTQPFVGLIVINTVAIYLIYTRLPSVIISFVMFFGSNIFYYLVCWYKFFDFEYDERSILITNSLNPFIAIEIDCKSIDHISLDYANRAGYAVKITWDNQTQSFIAGYVEKKDLQEMVEYIKNLMKTAE